MAAVDYSLAVLQQLVSAAKLDRKFYGSLVFDDYATGNAVVIVAGLYAALYLSLVLSGFDFSVTLLLNVALGGLVGWLIATGGLWVSSVFFFKANRATFATTLRLVGYAHVPLVLLVGAVFADGAVSDVLVAAALLWFVGALYVVAKVVFELETNAAIGAALIAAAAWWVLGRFGGSEIATIVELV